MKPIKNLFIIDDDEIFVLLTRRLIEGTNLIDQTKVFGDGEEAIDYLKEIAGNKDLLPDIILLDINMPVMDGWEFLNEYVMLEPKIEKKITLYLVSSSISPYDIERAKNIPLVTDFCIKPLEIEQIKGMLAAACHS